MLRITLFITFFCFLLFRPFQMESPGMLFPGDDYSYFAYSTSIAFGQYPGFSKEAFDEFEVPPLSRAGVGFMAAPFVVAFSMADRVLQKPIVVSRTKENIVSSWSLYGAVVAAEFYFVLACFLLLRGLSLFVPSSIASLSILFMVLVQGTGLYVFRRPVFSHIYELFLQSSFVYLLLSQLHSLKPWNILQERRKTFLIAMLSVLTLLVRQNGLPYAFLFPALLLCAGHNRAALKKRWRRLFMQFLGFFGFIFATYALVKYIPWFGHSLAYEKANATFENMSFFSESYPISFYIKRLQEILFGIDWGLFFTAPFLLIAPFGFIRFREKDLPFKSYFAILSLPILLNVYIAILWKAQGGWYGYRYVIYSAIPILSFPFAFLLNQLWLQNRKTVFLLLGLALLPVFSMLLFEATPHTLLSGAQTQFGGIRIGNATYQIEVWKCLLTQPVYAISAIFKAGPAYLIYAFANIFKCAALLPEKLKGLYPYGFSHSLFAKTLFLYALPLGMYRLMARGSHS